MTMLCKPEKKNSFMTYIVAIVIAFMCSTSFARTPYIRDPRVGSFGNMSPTVPSSQQSSNILPFVVFTSAVVLVAVLAFNFEQDRISENGFVISRF